MAIVSSYGRPALMDRALEAVVNRHLAAENEHCMKETLAALHPGCLFGG
jgi:hypothetical protein